ncbi:MAG TPA: IS1595 family transposase [Gaiellaceae bacterium]|nr:IS1595 family transposase [Gaiellaceae bacterium]
MEDLALGVYDEKFQDPLAAADYLESIRWPDGPVCPHCGESERKPYALKSKTRKLWKCAACRKQYTVTVGTIFEGSHIGLHKWLLAFYLLCSSKKGMSAHQLHRMLGVTYKSAWFMAHRIRYAMEQPPFARQLTGTVEADETYVGGKVRRSNVKKHRSLDPTKPDPRNQTGRGADKTPVFLLVERGGQARSFRVANVTGETLGRAIRRNVSREAHLRTDSYPSYKKVGKEYASHTTVDHSVEYVRGDAHTNTAENYFSILKRGIDGVYHHVSEAHLPRYLAEFDFRYNHLARDGWTDSDRTVAALKGVVGKRLTYAM